MATQTTRKSLIKPELADFVSLQNHFNNNWDKIDNMTCYNQDENITGNWTFNHQTFRIKSQGNINSATLTIAELNANKTLEIDLTQENRKITLIGNPTLDDWFNQSLKTTSSPTFDGLTLSGLSSGVVKSSSGVLSIGQVNISSETNLTVSTPLNLASSNISLGYNTTYFELISDQLSLKENGINHGNLSGLQNDNHTQYLLSDGTRELTGNWNAGAYDITARNIFLENSDWKKAVSSNAISKTIYVSASQGNDTTGDGSASNPYKTITKAISVLPKVITEPTIIAVSQGTYNCDNDGYIVTRGISVLSSLTIEARDLNNNPLYPASGATLANIYSNNTIGRSTLNLVTNSLQGGKVWITNGTGAGQIRTIQSNTSTTITVTSNWDTNPDSTSYFQYCADVNITGTSSSFPCFRINSNNTVLYGLQINSTNYYNIFVENCLGSGAYYCYIKGDKYGVYYSRVNSGFLSYSFLDIINNHAYNSLVLIYGDAITYGTVYNGRNSNNHTGIYVYMPSFVNFGTTSSYTFPLFKDLTYGVYAVDYVVIRNESSSVFNNVTHKFYYSKINATSLNLDSSIDQPKLSLINRSDTPRSPAIEFKTGSNPTTKFVFGVDENDNGKLKISPSSFGTNDRFVIDSNGNVKIGVLSSGETNNVVVHDNGVLQTRTSDSRIWGNSLVSCDSTLTSNTIPIANSFNTLIDSNLLQDINGNINSKKPFLLYDSDSGLNNAIYIKNLSPTSYNGSIVAFIPYQDNKYSTLTLYGKGTASTKQQANISIGSGVSGGDGSTILDQLSFSAEKDDSNQYFAIYNQAYPSGTIPFRNIVIGQRVLSSDSLTKFTEWDNTGVLYHYNDLFISKNLKGNSTSAYIDCGENYIDNGGFEHWYSSTSAYCWNSASTSNWNTGNNYSRESSKVVSYPYAVKIGDGSNSGRGIAQKNYFAVNPNTNYVLSAKVAGNETANSLIICIKAYDSSLTEITSGSPLGSSWSYSATYGAWYSVVSPNSTSYIQTAKTIITASNVFYLRISIQYYSGGTSGNKYIYLDNLQLTEGTIAYPFSYRKIQDRYNSKLACPLSVTNNFNIVTEDNCLQINSVKSFDYNDNTSLDLFSIDMITNGVLYGEVEISTHRTISDNNYGGLKKYRIWFFRSSGGTLQANSIVELTDFAYNNTISSDNFTYSQNSDTFTFSITRDHTYTPSMTMVVNVKLFGYKISNFMWC